MEQTTVSQYFTARKNSTSLHPSKRRKLDVATDSISIDCKHKRSSKAKLSQRKTSTNLRKQVTKEKQTAMSVNDLLTASPLIIRNEVTKVNDDHVSASPKRKLTKQTNNGSGKSQDVLSSMSNLQACNEATPSSKKSMLQINNDINEQAKNILHSRGAALVKASLRNCKNADDTNALKNSELQKKSSREYKTPISERRGRLRNKYANLLKDDNAPTNNVKSATPLQKNVSESSSQRSSDKFRHLTQKATPVTFALPLKYKNILEMFRCTDSVLFLLNQRSETCTYDRLKKSVQAMCGREFNHQHLASMKSIYPTAFTFRQEKNLHTAGSKTSEYQLTIEANFKKVCGNSSKISSSVLITRKLKFENNLLALTRTHHQKFLRKLNLKIEDSEIHRWHPNFKLDEVPDIEVSALPRAPIIKSITSAADLLIKARGDLAPKVEKALHDAASTSDKTNKDNNKAVVTMDTNKAEKVTSNTKLKGVSNSLLQRIRDKERKKMELAMTRDPKQEDKLSKMERLPEMCRILKSYFTAEKKAAITLEDCTQKLLESYGTSLHGNLIEEHVKLLNELVPQWLTIATVRKCPYVKLSKNYDINNVINELSKILKEEQSK